MKILNDKIAYEGAVFNIHERKIDLENDKKQIIDRQIMKTTDSITIALVNDQNKVLIVNEYRSPIDKFSWSLPAGRIDYSEDPAVTARRELAEETGYLIDPKLLKRVDKVSLSNGVMDEYSNIYIAKLLPGRYSIVKQKFDFDEDIREKKWVSINSAMRQTDGAASHIALLNLQLQQKD